MRSYGILFHSSRKDVSSSRRICESDKLTATRLSKISKAHSIGHTFEDHASLHFITFCSAHNYCTFEWFVRKNSCKIYINYNNWNNRKYAKNLQVILLQFLRKNRWKHCRKLNWFLLQCTVTPKPEYFLSFVIIRKHHICYARCRVSVLSIFFSFI